MPRCFFRGCSSRTGKRSPNTDVSLHSFPRNADRVKVWLKCSGYASPDINILGDKILQDTKGFSYRMCSLHFTQDCYIQRGTKKILKEDAVPKNISQSIVEKQQNISIKKMVDRSTNTECVTKDASTQTIVLVDSSTQYPEQSNSKEANIIGINLDHNYFKRSSKLHFPDPTLSSVPSHASESDVTVVDELMEERIANERKFVVFESCLDNLFKYVPCGGGNFCNAPVHTYSKHIDGSFLSVTGECFNGHTFLVWESQPRLSHTAAGNILSAGSIVFSGANFKKVPVSFDEVAVYFSDEEWCHLQDWEKNLYRDVMGETLEAVLSLGYQYHQAERPPRSIPAADTCITPYTGNHLENDFLPFTYDGSDPCRIKETQPWWEEEERPTSTVQNISNGCSECLVNGDVQCEHKNNPSNKILHKCSECKKIFGNWSQLLMHKRIHDMQKVQKQNENELMNHQTKVIPQQPKRPDGMVYQCSDCDETFSNHSVLDLHQRTHTGERLFKCFECDKSFTKRSHLTVHRKCHIEDRTFKCTFCEKVYNQMSKLLEHHRTHTGEKPFKCTECTKGFAKRSHLTEHLKIHNGKKPHKCNQCDKTFRYPSKLLEHQRTHTRNRHYQCTECEKSFIRMSQLIVHLRIHTGEKSYKCNECNKSFSQQSNLVVHQRSHTGERPFR